MRLIDADALIESLHDNSKHKPLMAPFKICTADIVDLKFLLNNEPTVDAVPVVRCRECKYRFKNNGHSKDGCPIIDANIWMDDDDFCSHGERKEGADNDT